MEFEPRLLLICSYLGCYTSAVHTTKSSQLVIKTILSGLVFFWNLLTPLSYERSCLTDVSCPEEHSPDNWACLSWPGCPWLPCFNTCNNRSDQTTYKNNRLNMRPNIQLSNRLTDIWNIHHVRAFCGLVCRYLDGLYLSSLPPCSLGWGDSIRAWLFVSLFRHWSHFPAVSTNHLHSQYLPLHSPPLPIPPSPFTQSSHFSCGLLLPPSSLFIFLPDPVCFFPIIDSADIINIHYPVLHCYSPLPSQSRQ